MISRVALSSALLGALSGCGASGSDSDPSPPATTLVDTVALQRGTLPILIEGYGEAAPAANGVVTLSIAQPGQVTAVATVAGASVAAGQPIATFAVAPSARSAFVQAQTTVRAAERARATTAQLLTQQLATRDQLTQAEKAATDARVALAALAKEGAGAATTTIRTPFAGIITTIPVSPGDRTQPGQALATIARGGALVVTVGIDPGRRRELHVGAPASLGRLDDAHGAMVAGRVVRVDATLNPKTRQVDVDIGYPAGAFLSGEALRVTIETGRATGWIVPHAAVAVDDGGQAKLFQVKAGKAKAVPIAVATSASGRDSVVGALDPSLPLIVAGAYQVSDGDAVRIEARR